MNDEQQQPVFDGHVEHLTIYVDADTEDSIRRGMEAVRRRLEDVFGLGVPGMPDAIEKMTADFIEKSRWLRVSDALFDIGRMAYQAGRADALPDTRQAMTRYTVGIDWGVSGWEEMSVAAEQVRQSAEWHFIDPSPPDKKAAARQRSREDLHNKRRELYGKKGKLR